MGEAIAQLARGACGLGGTTGLKMGVKGLLSRFAARAPSTAFGGSPPPVGEEGLGRPYASQTIMRVGTGSLRASA